MCSLHLVISKWNSNLPSSFIDPHKLRHTFTFFSHSGWKVCYKVPESRAQSSLYLWDGWKRHRCSLKPWHRISWLCYTSLFINLSYFHKMPLNIYAFINPWVEGEQYANHIVDCSLCTGHAGQDVSSAHLESQSLQKIAQIYNIFYSTYGSTRWQLTSE